MLTDVKFLVVCRIYILIYLCHELSRQDNRFLGDLYVESHPAFGGARAAVVSNKLFREAVFVHASGAAAATVLVNTTTDPRTKLASGDIVLLNAKEVRIVESVNEYSFTVDRPLRYDLNSGDHVTVKKPLLWLSEEEAANAIFNAEGAQISSRSLVSEQVHTITQKLSNSSISLAHLLALVFVAGKVAETPTNFSG